MNDISKNVLETIEAQHVKPKERWEFLLRRGAFWALFGLAVVVGSLAVAISLFLGQHDAWYASLESEHLIKSLAASLPYVWILVIVLLVMLAHYTVRQTAGGYRYRWYVVTAVSAGASLFLGGLLYAAGVAAPLEEAIYQAVPPYQRFEDLRRRAMIRPADGQLIGVMTARQTNSFELNEAVTDRHWMVIVTADTDLPPHWEVMPLPPRPRMVVIGETTGPGEFTAELVRPLFEPNPELRRRMMKQMDERKIRPMRIER